MTQNAPQPSRGATYVAIIEPTEGGTYSAFFPDIPGLITTGPNLDAIQHHLTEALALWLEDAAQEGEARPTARPLDQLRAEGALADLAPDALPSLVPAFVRHGAPRRINLSIDEGSLEAIDAGAQRRKMTRSAFMVSAVLETMRREQG